MIPGTIIILNGASSSGKTGLLRALQNAFAEPYLDAGIDKFLWMLPKRYLEVPLWSEIFEYRWSEDGRQLLAITAGSRGHVLMSGMHRSIAALARAGNHVLADHVLLEPAWVRECAALFAGLPAWLVGVRCPLEVLEARERARQDRTLGQARAQFEAVHAHAVYDLEVDTSRSNPEECARQVLHCVRAGTPRAWGILDGATR